MKFILRIMILVGFTACFNMAYSQDLSAEQVKEDLAFLKKQMNTYHPGLLEYNPLFEQQSDSLFNSVQQGMSFIQYFALISRQINFGHEGHYSVGNWSDTVHKGFGNNSYRYLPMAVHVLNNRVYVDETYTDDNLLQRGDEILSINGTTTIAILRRLFSFMASDGYIETNLNKILTSSFPWMYYLYAEQPEKFVIESKERLSGTVKTVTIDAITQQQMRENYRKKVTAATTTAQANEQGIEEFYTLEIKEGTAFLHLKSFDWQLVEKYKLKAGKLYKDIFQQLARENVQQLVIDLRYNTGGRYEFAYEMIPYLLKTETNGLYKTSIAWWGKKETFKIPPKSKWAFEGTVYMLVNGKTFSAGASLARYLREYANAIAIGEETGSRYEGYVAGSQQAVTLPNSGIRIGIPRYHTDFPPSEKQKTSNRGLIPDHIVPYSIDDVINKVDKERAFVHRLLTGNPGN